MLDLLNYCWSDSWRRYNLKGIYWCVNGDVKGVIVWPERKRIAWRRGLPWRRGKRILCMAPCRYIYRREGGGESHKRWGKRSIFMEVRVNPSTHHGLASIPELYLLILLFWPLFHLYQLGSSFLFYLD